MLVLVVGGAGYIGSHAARCLRDHGFDVVIFDNFSTGHAQLARGFDLIRGDLLNRPSIDSALEKTDAVMHFAAHAYVGESVENPRKYFDNNVLGGLNLLNACMDRGIKTFVFSSSCAVYGLPETVPIPEHTIRNPVNPYGVTKMIFEHALESYATAYGLRFAALRYFNAAGADESGEIGELHSPETHLIPLALQAAAGARDHIDIFGTDYPTPDGTCIRDYIHVSDLADAHVKALDYLVRENRSIALNLGTGTGHSVREILGCVESITGRKVPARLAPRRAGDPPALVADPRRAQQILGWRATRPIEEIVRTAWKWMQNATV